MEDKFEQLLRNQLSDQESRELLEAIENDSILKKEFKTYRDAWDLTKTLERRKLKEKVNQIHEQQAATPRKRWMWYTAAAASVLVLALFYGTFQEDTSGENIAQTYFKPYPDKFTSMGQNVAPLSEAMAAYNRGNYQKAGNLFSQLPAELIDTVELYQGICLYQMDQKGQAKKIFKRLIHSAESEYKEPALWYLSLAHLALDDKDSAIVVLNTIQNDALISFHKKDAKAILELLQ
ncbi:MAG: tol-pal system YbgF family protein [Bacteroidia bacterium]